MARQRSSRALTNDAAIRAAAVELILNDGIDALTFRDVARVAGLTHGAMYARFEDIEELLVDLWGEVLSSRATTVFDAAINASSDPSIESVRTLFDFVREATPTDVAMVQVLLSSRRFLILREEVETFVHDKLESVAADVTSDIHSRGLLLFALVLVQILQTSLFESNTGDTEFLSSTVLTSLKVDPSEVDSIYFREPTDRIIPMPSNDFKSQLAYHTFGAVGKSGYTRATISRISRRANCSPGAIYTLYPSKEDLVIAATRKIMEAPWISVSALADILDVGVLAQLLFSAASAQNEMRKNFTLEIAMASAHSDKIRAAVETQLQGLEFLVSVLQDISDEEKDQLRLTIRAVVSVTLATSFLSTVTKATDDINFNQFAEPLRRSFLQRNQPAWAEVRRQLDDFASALRKPVRRPLAPEVP